MRKASRFHFDRPRFAPGSPQAYIVAVCAAAVATALQLAVNPWPAWLPYIAYYPAAILVIFLCGSAAGLLSTVLAVLGASTFIFHWQFVYVRVHETVSFLVGIVTVMVATAVLRAAAADVRRLNETLRLSEGKFRGLLESAPDAMVIVDDRHRIVLVNARAEAMFGQDRTALVGRPITDLLAVNEHAAHRTRLAAYAADPPPVAPVSELEAVHTSGAVFPIEVSLGRLETENGVLVSNAMRDITARRAIEASLARASQAKSDFLASVSHELRTPLNAIIGFSEMIRDAIIGPLDVRYREYGGDIHRSGRHLQNLINDILDISKIEGGRLELRDELVSIDETIADCHRIVGAMAQAVGVALSVEVSDTLPLIRSDQVRFRQILLNIMSNAVKFTPSGGRVAVSAAVASDGVMITVADSGIGMKTEDIAVALEPFRQVDGPLSRRFDGTGLGLPLAKALVELHGGRLDIESTPGQGTTVRIRLPLERMTAAA